MTSDPPRRDERQDAEEQEAPHWHNMDDERERARVGLCFVCREARRIRSDRGSVFYFCQRSQTDPQFEKYPRLPVISCRGFEPLEETTPPRPS